MPCKEKGNKRSAVKNLFHSIVIASEYNERGNLNKTLPPPIPVILSVAKNLFLHRNLYEQLASLFFLVLSCARKY